MTLGKLFVQHNWDWIVLAGMVSWSLYIMISYASADIRILLDRVTVDDAFYYFGVAKNVVAGNGFTFDGINKTNGFQVLWMIFILPLFAVIHDPIVQIRAAVILSGFFYILSGLMIFLITKKLCGRTPALFAAFLWILNPTLLKIGITGMDNSMNAFFITLFLYFLLFFVPNKKFDEIHPEKFTIVLGGFVGLLTLSRIENALLGPIIAVYLSYMLYTKRHSIKLIFKRLFLLTSGFILVSGPYFAVNLFYFGSLTPISGKVKLFYEKQWLFESGSAMETASTMLGNIFSYLQYVFHLVFGKFAQYIDGFLFKAFSIVFPWRYYMHLLFITMLILLIVFVIRHLNSPTYKQFRFGLILFSSFVLAHFLFVSAILPHFALYNTWYFSIEFMFLVLWFALALKIGYENLSNVFVEKWAARVSKAGVVFLLLILLFSQYQFNIDRVGELNTPVNKTQSACVSFYDASLWMNDNLPPESRIGAFSAGILGFFSSHSVVNLDGFINSKEYLDYMQSGRFYEYIEDQHIGYIADYFTYNPTERGIGWSGGQIPRNQLILLEKWPLPGERTYYILQVKMENEIVLVTLRGEEVGCKQV